MTDNFHSVYEVEETWDTFPSVYPVYFIVYKDLMERGNQCILVSSHRPTT